MDTVTEANMAIIMATVILLYMLQLHHLFLATSPSQLPAKSCDLCTLCTLCTLRTLGKAAAIGWSNACNAAMDALHLTLTSTHYAHPHAGHTFAAWWHWFCALQHAS